MVLFLFYLLTLVFSIIGLAFTRYLFPKFSDAGYGFAKVIGLLIYGYFIWVLNFHNIVTLWVILLAIFAICVNLLIVKKRTLNWRAILIEESIFIFLFILMLIYRAHVPKIESIEKFMDFAIINGLLRGQRFPPMDVWFSGESINYYYYGHFLFSLLIKLGAIKPSIGYNILVATLFALSGTAAFSLGYNLTKKLYVGFASLCLLILAGNLDLIYNLLILHKFDYFYAQARSLIPNTINEFPSYSFLISDLHAHILNVPFVLLVICIILYTLIHGTVFDVRRYLLIAIIFGALGPINSWDYFIYLPALFIALLFATSNFVKALIAAALTIGLSLVLYLPFYVNFHPAVYGVGFQILSIRFWDYFKMFGQFIVILLLTLPVLIKSIKSQHKARAIILATTYAMLLMLIPQFITVRDIYFKLNPPFEHANTFFKFWYQAWVIFSIITPWAFYEVFSKLNNKLYKFVLTAMGCMLFIFVMYYPIYSLKYILNNTHLTTLDGDLYLKQNYNSERNLINWINKNVDGQPVLLEADGNSYSTDSLISSYTGLPTLVGWSSHELGWRGNWDIIANRMGDIEKLYITTDEEEALDLIKKYKIEYVVISKKEIDKYGATAGTVIKSLGREVFNEDDTTLISLQISK